jgi:uncharacterized membrane protein YfcA
LTAFYFVNFLSSSFTPYPFQQMWYFIIACIGSVIGFSAGLFGIGGALIATPLLNMLVSMPPMLALATPLPTALPSALSGTVAYYKAKLINFDVVKLVIVGAIPANLVGTWLTKNVAGQAMMLFTGGFMIIVGTTFFVRGWLLAEKEQESSMTTPKLIGIGVIAGFVSGFLAIGGGLVMVPAFVRVCGMKFKQATATSLFCVAILSIPATLGHWYLGHIDWIAAFFLALASTPASFLGAKAAIKLRNKTLERIYGTFMIAFALYFLWKQFGGYV